jgi:hypothetical protein
LLGERGDLQQSNSGKAHFSFKYTADRACTYGDCTRTHPLRHYGVFLLLYEMRGIPGGNACGGLSRSGNVKQARLKMEFPEGVMWLWLWNLSICISKN